MADHQTYSADLVRMWRVYRTCKEMAKDRGYEILQEECDITLAEFAARYGLENGGVTRQGMNFSCQPSEDMIRKYTAPATAKAPNPEPAIGPMWIEFNSDENVGLKQLREYIQHLIQGNYYSGIMITSKPMTGMALRLLRGAASIGEAGLKGGVEVFVEQDLLVNITKHELVPTHLLLSTDEKLQLLKRYRLKETQLPRIQVTDPVAKYYGLRRGQVVKIIRKSETAGRYASYRWAI